MDRNGLSTWSNAVQALQNEPYKGDVADLGDTIRDQQYITGLPTAVDQVDGDAGELTNVNDINNIRPRSGRDMAANH